MDRGPIAPYSHQVAKASNTSVRPLRRDAERNRQRILTAAAALYAEHGLNVSHDQIARAADVAVGTVYRRFPDRTALVEALFTDQVDTVVADARAALTITDPWRALATFMNNVLDHQAANRGLRELTASAPDGLALATHARAQIAHVVTELLTRAQQANVVRPDLTEQDLALIPIMIGAIIHTTGRSNPDLWRRTLAIVLNGLRPGDPELLPGTPPDTTQLAHIISTP